MNKNSWQCEEMPHSWPFYALFICFFSTSVPGSISVSVNNVTNPVKERWLVGRRTSLPEQTCWGRECKKHRVIRWDIVNILQSLYPWAIAWTASHKVMVSHGNCRWSFWSQHIQYFLKVCAGQVCTNQSLFGFLFILIYLSFISLGNTCIAHHLHFWC